VRLGVLIMSKGTILDEILSLKRPDVEQNKKRMPMSSLEARIRDHGLPINFAGALWGDKVRLIGEIKRASPSKGILSESFDPVSLATEYVYNGAAALSVLTEEHYFQGTLDHLELATSAIKGMGVPVLRKDFLYDPYQLYESRAYGADAALLIVSMLDPVQLSEMLSAAKEIWLQLLVEVHDEAELNIALSAGAEIIGINNRDLKTFLVDIDLSLRLRPLVPAGRIVVSESGIQNARDVLRLKKAGINAVLVGEALMTADDVGQKVQELSSV
jgi:indole-3-glycerol phosphate synthase